ncbi:hypothetical protein NDU88_005226 [Pleurodeles waltl]|uniref:Uncharacterized protein n=1 Tax=Pleurodeles waltl TaxID=8319 RepID=A0AAV7TU55_PLEWA|nr:hypothetical protein NDU88_005226 [Pleurodeles waltl]
MRSCPAGLHPVSATGSPQGANAAPIAPRGQETIASHRTRVHDDRPIHELYLWPQAGHIKKEKSEAQTEQRFTCPPSWPG